MDAQRWSLLLSVLQARPLSVPADSNVFSLTIMLATASRVDFLYQVDGSDPSDEVVAVGVTTIESVGS